MHKILHKAREHGFAIGAFNTANLEITKAICRAAKAQDFPVIIQTTPSAIEYAGLEQIYNIVETEIEKSGIEAAIHLDHGKNLEIVKQCINAGYRSVMIDGSKLPFNENVALTKAVVDYAHRNNVAVEGEIGVIGSGEGGLTEGKSNLSDPEQVSQFVGMTGVDSVAVSVGNEHGAPKGEKLNIELLKEIASRIEIPLVMHGCSGLSPRDIGAAIDTGVAKLNIDTQIRKAFAEGLLKPEDDYRETLKKSMRNVIEVVEENIKLFRNEN